MYTRLQDWARTLHADIVTLWLAAREPRVSLAPKLVAAFVAAYALSPIDLIPDFIPVLGMLDDLLIVPAGVFLVLRMIRPPELLAELRAEALARVDKPKSSWLGAALIVLIWLIALAVLISPFLRGGSVAPPGGGVAA